MFGYKPHKVKDEMRIFNAWCTHTIKENENKRKGALTLIKREAQQKKTTNIANYVEKYCKHDTAYNAVRYIEAASKYVYENADALKKEKPDAEGQRYIDFLHAVKHKLNSKALIDSLDYLDHVAPKSGHQPIIPEEVTRFLNDATPSAATKVETLSQIGSMLNLSNEFVGRVMKESPSLQMGLSQATPAPSQPNPQFYPQQQPGMMPPGMMYQGGYQQPGMMPPQQGQMYPPNQMNGQQPQMWGPPPQQGQQQPFMPGQQPGMMYPPQNPIYAPPPQQMNSSQGLPQDSGSIPPANINATNPYQNL
ncbi:hypothetical protein TVAG_223560 [Trichomonas vaginalis G3]|uniref:Uncharacterized protein n=1 Tax=Trichomonas vaginalis (strain ATCC PRA-98 / G3) TaxID=412133 RepID=A2EJ61_TRIV3|nr:hypothetical protein TVAGG3_0198940 [Trichomonas vaginalis G3]EAY07293.1 hypothetical protein TVAG_223560 [Trichomonas vaginalis G3]KAI5550465.1 hypothetical protein TVAGG3_0198940 [Trichomonas vaginalis G3]|eukprot:XP_001319516.1 hypothetical protein [Trichomonas vaginalis G3]